MTYCNFWTMSHSFFSINDQRNFELNQTTLCQQKVTNSRKFTQGFDKKVTLRAIMKWRLRVRGKVRLYNSDTEEDDLSAFTAQS